MKAFKALLILFAFVFTSCAHYGKVERQFNANPTLPATSVILFNGFDQLPDIDMLSSAQQIFGQCGIKVINQFDPYIDEAFQKAGFIVTEKDIDSDLFIDRMKSVFGVTHILMTRSYNPETDWHIQIRNIENKSPLFMELYDLSQEKVTSEMLLSSRTVRSPFPILGFKGTSKGTYLTSFNNGLRKLTKTCR